MLASFSSKQISLASCNKLFTNKCFGIDLNDSNSFKYFIKLYIKYIKENN